ncbi:uncharacterized protein EHS24_001022 [Apiotrichum porosum]|uniref:Chromatin modification-related protein EAF6 n=1 Tax=Apiotrichum porosum TaxID=105984 RepID=A0A427YBX7_9TREE|nr:uncharacterized protein EHS24_001022 [Apiotrichum porosum]RSH88477.1 hypothetical protein EHS24_001022 [Apiotrichum porosum]
MSQSGPPADAKQAQAAALAELENAQRRKRTIDSTLANLEASIWAFEGSYLDETAASGGNIVKGFDNYLKPPGTQNKKKVDNSDVDRLFSTSSVTFQQSLERQYAMAASRAIMPPPPIPTYSTQPSSSSYSNYTQTRMANARQSHAAGPSTVSTPSYYVPNLPANQAPHATYQVPPLWARHTGNDRIGLATPNSNAIASRSGSASNPIMTSDNCNNLPATAAAAAAGPTQTLPQPQTETLLALTPAEIAAYASIDFTQLSNAELSLLAAKLGPFVDSAVQAQVHAPGASASARMSTSPSTGTGTAPGNSTSTSAPVPATMVVPTLPPLPLPATTTLPTPATPTSMPTASATMTMPMPTPPAPSTPGPSGPVGPTMPYTPVTPTQSDGIAALPADALIHSSPQDV